MRKSPEILRLRGELAQAISEAVGPQGQFVVAPAYGISQPRMSELARGRVERCTMEWLIARVYRMGGEVSLTIRLPDVDGEFRRAGLARQRARRLAGG